MICASTGVTGADKRKDGPSVLNNIAQLTQSKSRRGENIEVVMCEVSNHYGIVIILIGEMQQVLETASPNVTSPGDS